MNNLKFRIWDKQNKKWLENSFSLHCFSNWNICPFTGNLSDFIGLFDGDHETTYTKHNDVDFFFDTEKTSSDYIAKESRYDIQQYIGLKDSQKKECFEGDIITFKPKSNKPPFYQVKYDSERACFLPYSIKHKCFLEDDENFPVFLYSGEFRILGNVYENPELI